MSNDAMNKKACVNSLIGRHASQAHVYRVGGGLTISDVRGGCASLTGFRQNAVTLFRETEYRFLNYDNSYTLNKNSNIEEKKHPYLYR